MRKTRLPGTAVRPAIRAGAAVGVLLILIGAFVPRYVVAAEPVARVGKSCPGGYRRSGEYCLPNGDSSAAAMKRAGSSCPTGYRRSGDYCIANRAESPHAIERVGRSCPLGYYLSGRYCIENKR